MRNIKSSRKLPSSTICSRSRWVAQITRTFTFTVWLSPRRLISPVSSTRNNLACIDNGNSPISSRKMVPPSATSKSPVRAVSAPVNAPRQCPNNSLSIRFSGSAPQFTATIGCSARKLLSCRARATSSFPQPVSPRIRTELSVGATFEISLNTRSMAGPVPTNFELPSARRKRCSRAASCRRACRRSLTRPSMPEIFAKRAGFFR